MGIFGRVLGQMTGLLIGIGNKINDGFGGRCGGGIYEVWVSVLWLQDVKF